MLLVSAVCRSESNTSSIVLRGEKVRCKIPSQDQSLETLGQTSNCTDSNNAPAVNVERHEVTEH